jgi:hypothetical protein
MPTKVALDLEMEHFLFLKGDNDQSGKDLILSH